MDRLERLAAGDIVCIKAHSGYPNNYDVLGIVLGKCNEGEAYGTSVIVMNRGSRLYSSVAHIAPEYLRLPDEIW